MNKKKISKNIIQKHTKKIDETLKEIEENIATLKKAKTNLLRKIRGLEKELGKE
jgi:predicted nuclease of restriction endonuclease-like RecB superfamily